MYNIQLLNKIAKVGTNNLDPKNYNIGTDVENPDGILVRSAAMHDMEFGSALKAIARAGAGVNNIPIDRCSENGIVVFNTPGANANAVKELALAALLLSSRKIVQGINWASTLTGDDVAKQVEAGKSEFVGPELSGKTLGVIGLGAIGAQLANMSTHLGMKVYGHDPFITVDAAWRLSKSVEKAASRDDIYENCDYISLHVPSTPDTKGMINKETIAKMKDGVRIINLARADLVNADDLKEALASGKVASYVTDFPTPETVGVPGIVAIPHLGASTPESEDNCAVMACAELKDFLETGNIHNSVNYPDAVIPHTGDTRICVFHKNIPNVLAQITSVLSENNINVENLVNRSKKDNAYTLVEITGTLSDDAYKAICNVESVVRVTVI